MVHRFLAVVIAVAVIAFCRSRLARCARHYCAAAIVDLLGRVLFFVQIHARRVDDLEQQSGRRRDDACRGRRDHAIFWREHFCDLLANFW